MKNKLNKTLIFRMVHYQNIPCLLDIGLHCANSETKCDNYINIGHQTLINRRNETPINIHPLGVLSDYVPFYFAYKMPMLYLIHQNKVADYSGGQAEVIYLVSTAEKVSQQKLQFVFSNCHAVLSYTHFSNQLIDLQHLDWRIIDETDYNKWSIMNGNGSQVNKEKKQAEFLVYQHFSVDCIVGLAVQNQAKKDFLDQELKKRNLNIPTHIVSQMYY
jgi:hypothetical protein